MRRRADRRFAALASILAAGLTAGAPPCAAQVEAGFDAAASVVKYDGYLASGAASFSPSLAWQSPRTTVTARGTVLVFESGNQSFQGTVTAGSFSSAVGPVRLEASGDAGASSYAGISWFAHGLARLRLHVLSGGWGLWAGPLGGMISRQGAGYAAAGYTAGAWTRGASGALEIGWTGVTVGDITYRDLQARARWRRGAFEVQALAASRSTSPAGPGGGYYDVTATVQLTPRLAVVAAAGRYPSDPVSGSIAGSYVTAGLRIAPRAAHLRAARPPARGMAPPPPPRPRTAARPGPPRPAGRSPTSSGGAGSRSSSCAWPARAWSR